MQKKQRYLMRWLIMIAAALIVGLILMLVRNDAPTNSPLRPLEKPISPNNHIVSRPHPLKKLTQNVIENSNDDNRLDKKPKPPATQSEGDSKLHKPPSKTPKPLVSLREGNSKPHKSPSKTPKPPVTQSEGDSKVHEPSSKTPAKVPATQCKQSDLSSIQPIKIVQYVGAEWVPPMKNCDIPCAHSRDRSESSLNTASAIVFHIPSFGENPRKELRGRGSQALTVAFSVESYVNYPRQNHLSDYDLTATYKYDSDLPVPYYGRAIDNLMIDISEWPWEKRKPAVLFIARNCKSKDRREKLVQMLQKYVQVDSLSSCLNNHPWPSDIPHVNKNAVVMRYRVYLAAENSIDKDYVTEKVYGGLRNGAVPIYLGAPNIEEFVPAHSFIPVPTDFTENDIVRIAGIVKQIFTNKTFYEEWIEFKKHPYEERFERKFGVSHTHLWCRLCRKLYALKNGCRWDKELQQIIFD